MAGKCRPSLREKTLEIVRHSNLSQTNKDCIAEVFKRYEEAQAAIEGLEKEYDRLFKEKLQQQAEIERLKKLLDDNCDRCIERERAKGRTEAITEFAERLKCRIDKIYHSASYMVDLSKVYSAISDTLREMKGEQ